jgi:hypothetical protein
MSAETSKSFDLRPFFYMNGRTKIAYFHDGWQAAYERLTCSKI